MYNKCIKFCHVWRCHYVRLYALDVRTLYQTANRKPTKDDAEDMWSEFLDNEFSPDQKRALQSVLAFYAVQGFRLGVRTGVTLGGDLG